ncbi:MAG: hypothetical protein WCY89_06235 [Flavobacteriaceae bacterium]
MKRFSGLFIIMLLLWACDDGDLAVTNFHFTNQTINQCATNDFLYNVNSNEVLILDIPPINFPNYENLDENGNVIPLVYTLAPSDKLMYRRYDGTVNSSVLCADFPASTPQVVEEWTAVAGATIEISTAAIVDSENGGITGISKYIHHIVIKDVIFKKGNSELIYEELIFGNYTVDNPVKFNFTDIVQSCSTNDLLFKLNLKEALVMEVDTDLFINEETPENQPRTALINGTNRIIYKIFDANVNGTYFCSTIPQTSPNVVQEWYAQNGTEGVSGIIEVETEKVFDEITEELVGYIHHIKLVNVRFYNNSSEFILPEYYFGEYGVEL